MAEHAFPSLDERPSRAHVGVGSDLHRRGAGAPDAGGEDEYLHDMPRLIGAQTLNDLSRLSPATSTAQIALEWSLIGAAIWLGWSFWSWWLYVPLVCFIGARQHALIVLMHEGAHCRLFRSRALNDWVAELLLSWPFVLFTMHAYRRNHWPHHRHVNMTGDPDWEGKQTDEWQFPKRPSALAKLLLEDLAGIGFVKFVVKVARLPRADSTDRRCLRRFNVARACFLIAAVVVITALGGWRPFLLFWVVPFVTWMQLAFHIRSIAEHFAIPSKPGMFGRTRTTRPGWLERVFLVPTNVGYHLEHHLYPSVPLYNLPKLHRLLMQHPFYYKFAHVTDGYVRVLRECTLSRAPTHSQAHHLQ